MNSASQLEIRILNLGDKDAVESFLQKHATTSMFLRSNIRAAGLEDHEKQFQASYLGAFKSNKLVGMIAHCWNGMILMQVPEIEILPELQKALMDLPTIKRRGIKGVNGEYQQARTILDGFNVSNQAIQLDSCEGLFRLDLNALKIPPLLQQGKVVCRRIKESDMKTLLQWRFDFVVEAIGTLRENINENEEEAFLRSYLALGHGFVLEDRSTKQILSFSAFSAALPDMVQIGGVWTPPELRGKSYGRSVVAGQLLFARNDGVKAGILFSHNPAAIRSYEAVGFQKIGDYGLTLFKEAWMPTNR